jgi:hypothetical protein
MDVERVSKVWTLYGLGLISLFLGLTSFVGPILLAGFLVAGLFFTLGWRAGHPKHRVSR